MISTKRLCILLLPIVLTSCGITGSVRNRQQDYLTARSIPPLKIPPGISSASFETYFPVSQRDYPESAKNPDLTPPGLYNYTKNKS